MIKKNEKKVCEGCLKLFSTSEIQLVNRGKYYSLACKKCCNTQYKGMEYTPFEASEKANKTKESYVKTAVAKDGTKLKIGQSYKGIEIVSIKKVSKTSEYNKESGKVFTEITFFISANKTEWTKI